MKELMTIFKNKKPIIGLIHLKGDTDEEIVERAKNEIAIYEENGVDAVLIENYYGNYHHMEMVLDYIQQEKPDLLFGLNCLNLDAMGFELATRYKAKFIQLDSVVGHMKPRDDVTLAAFLKKYRNECDAFVLGGVRFKYQPVLSERTIEEDLLIGMERCDAIVVTEDATGQETSMDKIALFKKVLKDFPLFVGAGVTKDNCAKQLDFVDGAIVGSYFKDTYKDTGDVCKEHVQTLVEEFERIRKEVADDKMCTR